MLAITFVKFNFLDVLRELCVASSQLIGKWLGGWVYLNSSYLFCAIS